MKTKRIGFIGAGNMAGAIISAIISGGLYEAQNIIVYDLSSTAMEKMRIRGVSCAASVLEPVENCDIIFLAVKPQNFREVLCELRDVDFSGKTLVSIAAGVSIVYIREILQADVPVIRLMPNMQISVLNGATAMATSGNVSNEIIQIIKAIFNSCGKLECIDETQMNDIVAINGSSPAFIYVVSKVFLDFAERRGIKKEVALNLFSQTLKGSGEMLTTSGHSVDELIREVSSPGGTTVAGLNVLEENNFSDILDECLRACVDRACELGK